MLKGELISLRSRQFMLLVLAFIILTILVASKVLDSLDDSITKAMVNSAGNTAIDLTMIIFSTIADIFPFYFSPILIISFIMLIRKKSRKVGAILLVSLVIAMFITAQLKALIDRDRPEYEFKPNIWFEYESEPDIARFAGSYPSGHAVRSSLFAFIIAYMLKPYSIRGIRLSYLIWILPIMVGISRVYIGVHYPSDVVGGILLGLIIANVFANILKINIPIGRYKDQA